MLISYLEANSAASTVWKVRRRWLRMCALDSFYLSWVLGPFVYGRPQNLKTSGHVWPWHNPFKSRDPIRWGWDGKVLPDWGIKTVTPDSVQFATIQYPLNHLFILHSIRWDHMVWRAYLQIVESDMTTITYVFGVKTSIKAVNWSFLQTQQHNDIYGRRGVIELFFYMENNSQECSEGLNDQPRCK